MARVIRDKERDDAPASCRYEVIQCAFDAGCCPELNGEALLDRLTRPIHDGKLATRRTDADGSGR